VEGIRFFEFDTKPKNPKDTILSLYPTQQLQPAQIQVQPNPAWPKQGATFNPSHAQQSNFQNVNPYSNNPYANQQAYGNPNTVFKPMNKAAPPQQNVAFNQYNSNTHPNYNAQRFGQNPAIPNQNMNQFQAQIPSIPNQNMNQFQAQNSNNININRFFEDLGTPSNFGSAGATPNTRPAATGSSFSTPQQTNLFGGNQQQQQQQQQSYGGCFPQQNSGFGGDSQGHQISSFNQNPNALNTFGSKQNNLWL